MKNCGFAIGSIKQKLRICDLQTHYKKFADLQFADLRKQNELRFADLRKRNAPKNLHICDLRTKNRFGEPAMINTNKYDNTPYGI